MTLGSWYVSLRSHPHRRPMFVDQSFSGSIDLFKATKLKNATFRYFTERGQSGSPRSSERSRTTTEASKRSQSIHPICFVFLDPPALGRRLGGQLTRVGWKLTNFSPNGGSHIRPASRFCATYPVDGQGHRVGHLLPELIVREGFTTKFTFHLFRTTECFAAGSGTTASCPLMFDIPP